MIKYASTSTLAKRTKMFGPIQKVTLNGTPSGNKEQQFKLYI